MWNYSSRNVLNFDFLEKDEAIVSSVYNFLRKMFLMLHSIDLPNILTDFLLLEILVKIYFVIAC